MRFFRPEEQQTSTLTRREQHEAFLEGTLRTTQPLSRAQQHRAFLEGAAEYQAKQEIRNLRAKL